MGRLRKRLVWFACGAATTAVIAIFAPLMVRNKPEPQPYLLVWDRAPPSPADPYLNDDERVIDTTAGVRLLYECGARAMHTIGVEPDRNGYTLLPLTKANSDVSECVITRGVKRGFGIKVIMTTNIYETHQI
jgi:hypothetical protein